MALYSFATDRTLEKHLGQEWLLTNGIGGFAGSTILGCNTRRYHGLLCAATLPPVGRVMLLSRLGEMLLPDGDEHRPMLEFSVNQFGERFFPRGDQYLKRFELNDVATWDYEVDGVLVRKQVQLLWKQNVVGVRYQVDPRGRYYQLHLMPLVAMRDFHALRHGTDGTFDMTLAEGLLRVRDAGHALYLRADAGQFRLRPDWWRGHTYAVEIDRGLDHGEDLFTPGRLVLDVREPTTVTLWAGAEPHNGFDWDAELGKRREAVCSAWTLPKDASLTRQRLFRAANDFVVYRKSPDGSDGTSILAGYPWFADWGRDTMISLPGLLLSTGRFAQAKQVLSLYARYVSEGMIPNRFDDYNNEPHYNTVDASLWFIHAVFEYLRISQDQHTFEEILQPACRAIFDGYRKGTRFNIHMDQADGLLNQGDPSTQLTWMDAKCNGVVFTPRQGKAVEINALWYNAAIHLSEKDLAARIAESFRKAFWISPFRGLADVANDGRQDRALRPNQIFAVSLPHSPLTLDQQHAVVEVVRRELLTPMGLRSLAKSEPGYKGRYHGGPMERDGAYHNGTVWAWLIGPFLEAYLRVHQRSPESQQQARQWLAPLIQQMEQYCVGQIAEVYEGDPPHRAVGCCAQAWSVAEVLRLACELNL